MADTKYKNWSIITDSSGVCWLTFDRANTSANTFGQEVLLEFDDILNSLTARPPKGLVIKSGKANGYIAGADISEFMHMTSVTEARQKVRSVQLIFDKLAALPCPTVAMINGFCLGGGYEMALACKYRVALDTPKTKIGLPEIMLGVQPGWGGSVRLPRLIGSLNALSLILPGKTVDARTAYKLGMVDAAVPERYFQSAVEYYLTKAPKPKQAGSLEKIIQVPFVRKLIGKYLTKETAKKAKQKYYPAPFAVINAWVDNSIFAEEAFVAESASIGELMLTPTARNLVRVFFLRERLKGFAKTSTFKPQHVHVIGAGVMGGDIAAWCALMGFTVTVQDQNLKAIAATCERALQLYTKRLKIPFLIQAARDRLVPDKDGLGIPTADVIIEAIIENAEAKQALFTDLEKKAKANAILASNTSTIPLSVIGKNMQNPSRVVGIHFFNPVALMPLVEVVSDDNTNQEVLADTMLFVGKIDKLPLPVKSAPGFLVNRVLIPYFIESAMMFDEGIPPEVIDKAATEFGMPMGPIELMDAVGLDICVAAATSMHKPISEKVAAMVKAGKLGKKSGEGFYKYKNGKIVKPKINPNVKYPEDITDRLIMSLVNEAASALREGIVTDVDLVDAGLIFGAGFAPFRGGPMTYANELQKSNVKALLEKLAAKYGVRFNPDPYWSVQ